MEKFIATLYKKIALSTNFYILIPQKASVGHIDEMNSQFITKEKEIFESINNLEALKDPKISIVYDDEEEIENAICGYEEMMGAKVSHEDYEQILEDYFEKVEEDIIITQITEDKTICTYYLNLNTLASFMDALGNQTPKDADEGFFLDKNAVEYIKEATTLEEMKERLFDYLIKEEKESIPSIQIENHQNIDLQELEDYVKERIIGHDEAIEDIATILVNNLSTDDPREIERILVAGPTGIGKTETFKSFAEYLKVPFANYATTTLSDSGLVGKDVDDILKYVLFQANGNLEQAKRAIVILDEIDKLAIRDNAPSQESVQQNLLKLLEGHTFDLKNNYDQILPLDTSFMSFIGCGAFPSLFEEKKIGFQSGLRKKTDIQVEQFLKFGMISELMGRFGQIQVFNALTEEERFLVLTQSKISPFFIKQTQFDKRFSIHLEADESYYKAILETTKNSVIGLRDIKSKVNKSLLKLENQIMKSPNVYHEAIVSEETVKNNRQYILKK